MSYLTYHDFLDSYELDSIKEGNESCDFPCFENIVEKDNFCKEVKCNIGGLLAANDFIPVSVHAENKNKFLEQVKLFNFTSAFEILTLWDIIDNSRLDLSEDELKEIDNKIMSINLKKLPTDNLQFMIGVLIRAVRYLEIDFNVFSLRISEPQSQREIVNSDTGIAQNIDLIKALTEWTGPQGEKEELITKLFALE